MEHLSALDAAFWYGDDPHAPLHIAGVAVFEGPAPRLGELRRVYRHKLHLVPRLRQRLRTSPLGLARPAWTDDASFRLEDHVSRRVVPPPGGTAELLETVTELLTPALEPDRPLWHAWQLTGLPDDRWALVSKLHHCMVDGVAGLDVVSRLLDVHADDPLPAVPRWQPHPAPSRLAAATEAVRSDVLAGAHLARATRAAGLNPVTLVRRGADVARGTAQYLRSAGGTTSSESLTGVLRGTRDYRVASVPLREVQAVRHELGGSVNDVVLAAATAVMRNVLFAADERAAGQVRCLVPVSVRGRGPDRSAGNRVSALLVDLPVEFADPVTRYRAVVARTRQAKASHEADAGVALATALDYVPPALLSLGMRALRGMPQGIVTTVVTNVPGPSEPRFLLGRRMIAHYPFVPVAERIRVGIAVTSYDHELFVGITCDRAAHADIDAVEQALRDGFGELVRAVAGAPSS